MTSGPVRRGLPDSGALWFVVSVACSLGGVWLAERTLSRYTDPPPGGFWWVLGGLALIFVAGYAAWRLARAGIYSWLLPLAAFCLLLVEPGRAGDVRTWRLEWGVMGLVWTLAAVLVFARLLRRSDELERRLHLEGAFFGLVRRSRRLGRLRPLREPPPRAARAVGGRGAPALVVGRLPLDGPPLPVAAMKNRLRVLRAERDWSQADLADRLSVSRQTVNSIENERYDPSLPLAFAIARVFACASRTCSRRTPRRRSSTSRRAGDRGRA